MGRAFQLGSLFEITPLPFKGESGPDVADFWIVKVKKKFRVMNCAEEDKVRLGTYLLQGHVEQWWQSMTRTKYANHEGPIPWEEFLVASQDKYFLEHVKDQKEREFNDLI